MSDFVLFTQIRPCLNHASMERDDEVLGDVFIRKSNPGVVISKYNDDSDINDCSWVETGFARFCVLGTPSEVARRFDVGAAI